MVGNGFDRARTLLQPCRFGFPPIAIGIVDDGDRCLVNQACDLVFEQFSQTVARSTLQINVGYKVGNLVDRAFTYSVITCNCHHKELSLLETVASYAGSDLPAPMSERYWNFPEQLRYSDVLLCDYELRWYLHVISDSRFSQQETLGTGATLRFCVDAFRASWTLLNERLGASPEGDVLTPIEARNKFCFDRWQNGQSYKQINVALKQRPEWEAFEDNLAVRSAIQSWAKRIGAEPRKGQPGRRSKT